LGSYWLSIKRALRREEKTAWDNLSTKQIADWYKAVDQTQSGHAPEAERHGKKITLPEAGITVRVMRKEDL